MAEIFLCRPGAITTRAARRLTKAGIIVVETDDVKAVQFVRAGEVITGSKMLAAALHALVGDGYRERARAEFVASIAAAATEAIRDDG